MEMVYRPTRQYPDELLFNCPKVDSVVNVFPHRSKPDYVCILGYELSKDGVKQFFHIRHFRPLDEVLSEISIEELTHQLV